ncbi:PAS domain S-box protein [Enhydrobacter sp.]|jgi:PAS domain S-box-containing protein|uniref:PAS domain-containing protein n=1 Tax=Enhydrobacter sp. TaxID=1894999 RepID=UPI002633CD5D|nr:PAS domain S-box protein [Enhydrobacter sp.]WIM12538.1 MAG: PAS/PAC domain-containing protein [Enhydrobacter sp.]
MAPDVDRFYRTFVNETPDAIIYADAQGRVGFWNKGAERIFGFSEAEMTGKPLDCIVPEPLRQRHRNGFSQTVRTGRTRYGAGDVLAVPALRKDGVRISVEFTIVPFRDRTGRILGIAATLRDVTRRFEEMKSLRKSAAAQ